MKIDKYEALKVFIKHLSKKFGNPNIDMGLMMTSLMPLFTHHKDRLQKSNILDPEDHIDVDVLEDTLLRTFDVTPIFNINMGTGKVSITEKDALAFIADLKQCADIEQPPAVICLPAS